MQKKPRRRRQQQYSFHLKYRCQQFSSTFNKKKQILTTPISHNFTSCFQGVIGCWFDRSIVVLTVNIYFQHTGKSLFNVVTRSSESMRIRDSNFYFYVKTQEFYDIQEFNYLKLGINSINIVLTSIKRKSGLRQGIQKQLNKVWRHT